MTPPAGPARDHAAENPATDGPPEAAAGIVKRSVLIAGHRTSVSLEPAFWRALRALAAARGQPVSALIAAIDLTRAGNLSSAIRVFVLEAALAGGPAAVAPPAPPDPEMPDGP